MYCPVVHEKRQTTNANKTKLAKNLFLLITTSDAKFDIFIIGHSQFFVKYFYAFFSRFPAN